MILQRNFKIILFPILLLTFLIFGLFACSEQQNFEWEIKNMNMNESFHDIELIDHNIAYAYSYGSGKIIKTIDAGNSWEIIHRLDSVYLEQIQFINQNIGFICGNDNTLLKTENGGVTWSSIAIDTLDISTSIYGMHFIDENIGFIAVLNKTNAGFSTVIFKTVNAGNEWIKINEIPEMILNLEIIDDQLWGSGHNVILKNIDKTNWEYEYRDTTKKTGQIRDMLQIEGSIYAASFNGYILTKTVGNWSSQQITKNRLRSIAGNESIVIAVGDNNKEKGNLFTFRDMGVGWVKSDLDLQDIHRINYKNDIFWSVGKNDQLLKLEN